MIIHLALKGHILVGSKIGLHQLKLHEICVSGVYQPFLYLNNFYSKNWFEKKWPCQKREKWAKILNYLFKLALFSSKRHQVDFFLSTFMTHMIHFWNPQILEISYQKFKTMPFWRKNWENQYLNCFGLSFSNGGSTSNGQKQ